MQKTLLAALCILFSISFTNAQTKHHYHLNDLSADPNSSENIRAAVITLDGGMLVVNGTEYRPSVSGSDYGFSIIKYDAAGNKLWNTYLHSAGGALMINIAGF